jgi:hypothetical protein
LLDAYSAHNAITGSIRVARRAGNQDAHSVTSSKSADTAMVSPTVEQGR